MQLGFDRPQQATLAEAINGTMEEFGLARLRETIRSGSQDTAQAMQRRLTM